MDVFKKVVAYITKSFLSDLFNISIIAVNCLLAVIKSILFSSVGCPLAGAVN